MPTNIDPIPPNTTHSCSSAMLYVFEDNEAISKMMIRGPSPTMRHVSRTHRVALDWLFHSKPNGCWDRTAEEMIHNFQRSGHLVFRETSALERGELRSKGSGMKSIHFNGSTQNIELLLQIVISVNQLSLYGAAADLIKELPDDQRAPGKHVELDQMEQEIITQLPFAEVQADDERQGNLLRDCERRFENYQKTRSYPNCAPKHV